MNAIPITQHGRSTNNWENLMNSKQPKGHNKMKIGITLTLFFLVMMLFVDIKWGVFLIPTAIGIHTTVKND